MKNICRHCHLKHHFDFHKSLQFRVWTPSISVLFGQRRSILFDFSAYFWQRGEVKAAKKKKTGRRRRWTQHERNEVAAGEESRSSVSKWRRKAILLVSSCFRDRRAEARKGFDDRMEETAICHWSIGRRGVYTAGGGGRTVRTFKGKFIKSKTKKFQKHCSEKKGENKILTWTVTLIKG